MQINGVQVFSATMREQREVLGDRVSGWLADRPEIAIADIVVTQSSDREFHCVAITVFYFDPARSSSAATGRRLAFKESGR